MKTLHFISMLTVMCINVGMAAGDAKDGSKNDGVLAVAATKEGSPSSPVASSFPKDSAEMRLAALDNTCKDLLLEFDRIPSDRQNDQKNRAVEGLLRVRKLVASASVYVKANPNPRSNHIVSLNKHYDWGISTADRRNMSSDTSRQASVLQQARRNFFGGAGRAGIGELGGYRDLLLRASHVAYMDISGNFPNDTRERIIQGLDHQAGTGTVTGMIVNENGQPVTYGLVKVRALTGMALS